MLLRMMLDLSPYSGTPLDWSSANRPVGHVDRGGNFTYLLKGCAGVRPIFARQASGKNLNLNDESQHGLLMQLLKLSYNCLNYDFIGTSTDESSDDLCTVQIPTSWRSGSVRFWHRFSDVPFWFRVRDLASLVAQRLHQCSK